MDSELLTAEVVEKDRNVKILPRFGSTYYSPSFEYNVELFLQLRISSENGSISMRSRWLLKLDITGETKEESEDTPIEKYS